MKPTPYASGERPAIIALGSNLGDSARTIREAFGRLERLSQRPVRMSSLWETTPVDCPPGSPRFLNAVAVIVPTEGETPEALLAKLQAIEQEFGRGPRKAVNEARTLDLDLIAFGSETRNIPGLILPHPRAHLRRFVLAPLAEIAPGLILPGQPLSVAGLLNRLPPDDTMRRMSDTPGGQPA